MMTLFFLVCIATVLIALGIGVLLLGSYLLGRPLSKGCGKTDCCKNRNPKPTSKESPPHDDDNTPPSTSS
nr:hypothetical protein [Chlamydia pecorum]